MKNVSVRTMQWIVRVAHAFRCDPGELYPIISSRTRDGNGDLWVKAWYVRDLGFFRHAGPQPGSYLGRTDHGQIR